MSETDREPQLPKDGGSPGGREPALSEWPAREPGWTGRKRAAEVLAEFVATDNAGIVRELVRDCCEKTVAEWWATTCCGDLMALVLPMGPPQSPARRKAASTACRIIRLSRHRTDDAEDLRTAFETVERWAAGDPSVTSGAVEEAVLAVRYIFSPHPRSLAVAVISACCVAIEPDPVKANDHLWQAANAAIEGFGWRAGHDFERRRADCADIIREEYPDIGAVLMELQAERRGGI